MIPKYGYPEFKRKLCANPNWIARGLIVLAKDPEFGPSHSLERAIDLMHFVMPIEKYGGKLPWSLDSKHGKAAVKMVRKFAPDLFRFYIKQHEVPETTS